MSEAEGEEQSSGTMEEAGVGAAAGFGPCKESGVFQRLSYWGVVHLQRGHFQEMSISYSHTCDASPQPGVGTPAPPQSCTPVPLGVNTCSVLPLLEVYPNGLTLEAVGLAALA